MLRVIIRGFTSQTRAKFFHRIGSRSREIFQQDINYQLISFIFSVITHQWTVNELSRSGFCYHRRERYIVFSKSINWKVFFVTLAIKNHFWINCRSNWHQSNLAELNLNLECWSASNDEKATIWFFSGADSTALQGKTAAKAVNLWISAMLIQIHLSPHRIQNDSAAVIWFLPMRRVQVTSYQSKVNITLGYEFIVLGTADILLRNSPK